MVPIVAEVEVVEVEGKVKRITLPNRMYKTNQKMPRAVTLVQE